MDMTNPRDHLQSLSYRELNDRLSAISAKLASHAQRQSDLLAQLNTCERFIKQREQMLLIEQQVINDKDRELLAWNQKADAARAELRRHKASEQELTAIRLMLQAEVRQRDNDRDGLAKAQAQAYWREHTPAAKQACVDALAKAIIGEALHMGLHPEAAQPDLYVSNVIGDELRKQINTMYAAQLSDLNNDIIKTNSKLG